MTIEYGAASTGGGAQNFRVGYEITSFVDYSTGGAINSGTATASAEIQFYVRNAAAVTNDTQNFAYTSGTATMSGVTSNSIVNTQTVATDRTIGGPRLVTFNYTTWGSSPGNFTGSITGSAFYVGSNCTQTWSIPIPARPGGVPTSPSITATANVGAIYVSWSATADPAITRYDVYRNNDPAQLISSSTATSINDTVGNNVSAYYVMYAINDAGTSSAATSSTVTTPSLPGQPGSLAADTSTFGTIGLTWTASSTTAGYGVTYTIDRTPGGTFTTASTAYNDTTVAPSTAYTYTVTPSSGVGTGTAASISTTSLGGVVNVWNGAWVKVVPQVRNSANTAWVTGQARSRNNTTSEWKYGS